MLSKGLSKLKQHLHVQDVTAAAAALSAAVLRGASRSTATAGPHPSASTDADAPPPPDLLERLLAALDSERGQNLVGLAVSMACRTSVQTLVDSWASADPSSPAAAGVHLHVESLASGFGEGLAQQRAAAGGQTPNIWLSPPLSRFSVCRRPSASVRFLCRHFSDPVMITSHVAELAAAEGPVPDKPGLKCAGGWLPTLLQWAATPEGEHLVLNTVGTFVRQVGFPAPSRCTVSACDMLAACFHRSVMIFLKL